MLKKLMSDSGSNFISDKFKTFCRSLSIEPAFSSSYHHQSNGQVEVCIKFVKYTFKKSFDSRSDLYIALLQIQVTPLEQGLPSPAMMLFNCPIRGIMLVINRLPIGIDNDDEHHKMIIERQTKNDKDKDTSKNFVSLPTGSTVLVQHEDGGLWTHGTIEGKGDHNHHNRSYIICITKTGRLVT